MPAVSVSKPSPYCYYQVLTEYSSAEFPALRAHKEYRYIMITIRSELSSIVGHLDLLNALIP